MERNSSYFLIPTLILILGACVPNPEIRFLEPQPKNKNSLSVIPREYQGVYLSKSDSSILTIDSRKIIHEWDAYSRVSNVEMQEVLDTIYSEDVELELDENWTMFVDIEGDSAIIRTYGVDTIFVLNGKTELRKFKGYLFLNYPRSDSTWSVKTLKLQNNQLDIEELVSHSEIDSLRNITTIITEIDTSMNRAIHHDLKPKRRELKAILVRKKSDAGFIKSE